MALPRGTSLFVFGLLLLVAASAVVAKPTYEIRPLSDMVDVSQFADFNHTHRKLLQAGNTPRETYTIAGSKIGIYNFRDFVGATNQFRLFNGAIISGSRLRLTSASGPPNQRGQAVIRSTIPFYNIRRSLAGVFGCKFSYQFSGPNTRATCAASSRCPGHGFTFTFQAGFPNGGGSGSALGYGGSGQQGVAVEFDVVQDAEASDISNNHIGFNSRGGIVSLAPVTPSFDIVNNNLPATVWIEFWPQLVGVDLKLVLNVFITNGTTKPVNPVFTTVADPRIILNTIASNDLYVGFTASTGPGNITSTFEIINWGLFTSILGAFT